MQLWTARVPRTVVITVATIFRIFAILVHLSFIKRLFLNNTFLFIHFLWRRDLESLKRGGYDAGCPLLGDTPKPHSSYFLRREDLEPLKRGGYNAGCPLLVSINPNPFFIRRGFRPLPKPLANLWQGT